MKCPENVPLRDSKSAAAAGWERESELRDRVPIAALTAAAKQTAGHAPAADAGELRAVRSLLHKR